MDSKKLQESEILNNHGNISNNMLDLIVNGIDSDQGEIDVIKRSSYYSHDNLPEVLEQRHNNFNILSLNIQSIGAKFDSLQCMLSVFEEQDIIYDIISIQESWLPDDFNYSLFTIEGYNMFTQGCFCSSHGGLITYVRNNLNASCIKRVNTSHLWEGIFVKITDTDIKSDVIVGNIYRPPRNNNNNETISQFLLELDPLINELSQENNDILISGDFNIDLLKINERALFADYLDSFLGYSFYPKITMPTRLATHSASLIDNIFAKLSPNTIDTVAGIIVTNLSDHFPYFLSMRRSFSKHIKYPSHCKQRLNSTEAKKKLLADLISTDLVRYIDTDPLADPNSRARGGSACGFDSPFNMGRRKCNFLAAAK